jgi:hypothetical protein
MNWSVRPGRLYEDINQNIAKPAMTMTAVANQPAVRNRVDITNLPMILEFTAMNMISPIIGTETTPLMTALQ